LNLDFDFCYLVKNKTEKDNKDNKDNLLLLKYNKIKYKQNYFDILPSYTIQIWNIKLRNKNKKCTNKNHIILNY
jgi:hypothetical protein